MNFKGFFKFVGTLIKHAALLVFSVILGAAQSGAAQDTKTEYDVKAAYLYNFSNYVEWPSGVFADNGSVMNFCILADAMQTLALEKIPHSSSSGRLLELRFIGKSPALGELSNCHVVYVSTSRHSELAAVTEKLAGSPSLLISDEDSGVINFVVQDQKVRFAVNLSLARKAGLKISSQILKLAVSVTE